MVEILLVVFELHVFCLVGYTVLMFVGLCVLLLVGGGWFGLVWFVDLIWLFYIALCFAGFVVCILVLFTV